LITNCKSIILNRLLKIALEVKLTYRMINNSSLVLLKLETVVKMAGRPSIHNKAISQWKEEQQLLMEVQLREVHRPLILI
jgi:hypothetical protein